MKFVNRISELAALQKWWREKKAHLIILYGKRRVGKTSLALKFSENKSSIYYLADRLPANLQLKKFAHLLGDYFKDPLLKNVNEWETLFQYLGKQKKPIVVIVDEFPYLVESDQALSSVFQKGWDLYLKNAPVFLILSGSSLSMMLEHVLTYKAPLYGRRTGNILLKPFTIFELKDLYPKKSFYECLLIYSFVGGTPSYLEFFEKDKDAYQIIKETAFLKEHFLYQEVEFLLREELREPKNYFAILSAIANKNIKLSEIISITGFEKSFVSSYLKTLQNLGLIKRDVPVTEKYAERSKKGHYSISDSFISFWFDYVFPYRDRIERGEVNSIIFLLKQKESQRLSRAYESQIAHIFLRNAKMSFSEIGRWWDKEEEIDLVALNAKENIMCIGEAKWTEKEVDIDILLKLQKKRSGIIWGNQKTVCYYALFSKKGFTGDLVKFVKKEKNTFLFHGDKLIFSPNF